jgi:uncharacterized protein (TIGR02147 family)
MKTDKNRKSQSIFQFKDYKDFLESITAGSDNWGMLSKLAQASGCQKSYLSRVIHKEVHLTPEQAYRIGQFLGLNELESEYFSNLVEFGRSGDRDHRESLSQKLQRARRMAEKVSKEGQKNAASESLQMVSYYTRMDLMVVHYLTSIPEYQTAERISQQTSIGKRKVETILQELQSLKLVEKVGSHWKFLAGDEHMTPTHPLLPVFQRLLRERALLALSENQSEGVHFSALQTISKNDFEKIKQIILKATSDFHKVARPSKPEELVVLCIDYFKPFFG